MCVCVCVLPTFSNIFSSKTTGPIEIKFQIAAFLGQGNESLYWKKRYWPHDQDVRHAHIW